MIEEHYKIIEDTKHELYDIKTWIDFGKNKFDSKTRFLISYSVIKACGTIEVVVKKIIYDRLSIDCCEETKTYLNKMIIDSSCNPNTGNIEKILQLMSSDWKEEFCASVSKSGKKDKLNSLVQLRNDFAHGRNVNTSIESVIMYYNESLDVVNILDLVMKN